MFFSKKQTMDHGPWTIVKSPPSTVHGPRQQKDQRGSAAVNGCLIGGSGSQVRANRIEEWRDEVVRRNGASNLAKAIVLRLRASASNRTEQCQDLPSELINSHHEVEQSHHRPWRLSWVILILCFASIQVRAQTDSLNKKRLLFVGGTTAVGYTGTMLVLNEAWYSNYPRSSFHFINDNAEWLQMDKVGHAWSAQGYALAGIEVMKWTGMPRKKAIWIGGIGAMFFQTSLEVFDGFSAKWGASGGDMIANTLGTALAVGQELLWDEQRIQLKYSFHLTDYAAKRPNLLGDNFFTRTLKDYNGQTYWLSVNPWSFAKGSDWPKWLNISMGYGADGMLGGHSNTWIDGSGMRKDYSAVPRQRQLYFSLDIDLQRLPLKNPFLQRLAKLANVIKIPAPTLMYQEGGKWQFYPLYF